MVFESDKRKMDIGDAMELLELKGSGASKLLSNLVQADIIEPVSSHGKGKYKFKK